MNTTVHQFLKESTRKQHESAEVHPFQGALAQGQLPLESYKRYIRQLEHLHRGFEGALRRAAQSDGLLKQSMKEDYYQLAFLEADAAALRAPEDAPFECVQKFVSMPVFEKSPVSLLGTLYVLLGSKHGGKFIAHKSKEVYKLGEAGYTYFNPYGDSFRQLWQDFTGALNALPADEDTLNVLLEAANATFDIFVEIGDVIWRREESTVKAH